MKLWLRQFADITHLCLETACPLCQRSTAAVLCASCQQQLQRAALLDPTQCWQPPLPVFAWGQYGGQSGRTLKRTIAALKYERQTRLAELLGQALAERWLSSKLSARPQLLCPQRTPVVVPIPMHREKQQQRGFNQAELIARVFCQQTGLPFVKGLSRQRPTLPQFELSAAARAQNLAEAFTLGAGFRRPPKSPITVLLLDDIYTTGATALSAAQTLRRHQISVYGVLAVAKAGDQASSAAEPVPERENLGHSSH